MTTLTELPPTTIKQLIESDAEHLIGAVTMLSLPHWANSFSLRLYTDRIRSDLEAAGVGVKEVGSIFRPWYFACVASISDTCVDRLEAAQEMNAILGKMGMNPSCVA